VYLKFYNSSKHLATDINVLFKQRIMFEQNTPKKHKCFIMKIYKLTGYSETADKTTENIDAMAIRNSCDHGWVKEAHILQKNTAFLL
jgi:hypothetical protein